MNNTLLHPTLLKPNNSLHSCLTPGISHYLKTASWSFELTNKANMVAPNTNGVAMLLVSLSLYFRCFTTAAEIQICDSQNVCCVSNYYNVYPISGLSFQFNFIILKKKKSGLLNKCNRCALFSKACLCTTMCSSACLCIPCLYAVV